MHSDLVGLKLFYKFKYGLIFDPTHLELDSPGLNSWWALLVHQSANKGSHKYFFFKLDSALVSD